MSNATKQQTVLAYLLIKFPNITVGRAARLLNQWEYRVNN